MSKPIVVTEQEYIEWRGHSVTQAFLKALFNDRENLKEMLVAGTENDEDVRGRAAAIVQILRMDYRDLMDSLASQSEVRND
ncbi:MAG: hypothetical protein JHC33_08675 [Ignisphaera sp.]|nr:hypothetical protein [Ignisphaera sp.]